MTVRATESAATEALEATGTADQVVTALVPLRGGPAGKSRLGVALGPDHRGRLVAHLARHVVDTLGATPGVGRVVVVTPDPEAAARDLEGTATTVEVVRQPTTVHGLNPALDHARGTLAGPSRLLVVHADLPGLTVEDVRALLGLSSPVVVATDRAGLGTNALLLAGAGRALELGFGAGSRRRHEAAAARRGLEATVVRRPGTGADLDTPADWAALPLAVRDQVEAQVPGTRSALEGPAPH
ncbi:2-phospho-L-lactate guanylyltransferase [Actinotalea sp. BY-33]|uniref:Phosphoenolpyruvate guanylyltransferase n=1 Tax=Actinotalea soli TaxID=2819234 RepID=A0A939LNN3_9CELL|nr:2-phospho-L-lactate guanylyltransferase [Actinotalea soli]MBO1751797.1 2-phospho-L-lactate guanylyltransferase [Actinotalea soli]